MSRRLAKGHKAAMIIEMRRQGQSIGKRGHVQVCVAKSAGTGSKVDLASG